MLSYPRSAWWQPQSLVRAVSILARGASPQSGGRLCHVLRGDHAFHHSCEHPRGASLHSCEILRGAFHHSYVNHRVVCDHHSCENGASPRFFLSGADPHVTILPSPATRGGDAPCQKSVACDQSYFHFCSLRCFQCVLALLGEHQYLCLGQKGAAPHFLIHATPPQSGQTRWQARQSPAR